jgi:hypothetical protein
MNRSTLSDDFTVPRLRRRQWIGHTFCSASHIKRLGSRRLLRLPEPMLAKPGPIPVAKGWLFEPKMDGFRCLVFTHGGRFLARSRRGWEMTERLPELGSLLPADVQLDGELVARDADGRPDFPPPQPPGPSRSRATPRFAEEFARATCSAAPRSGVPSLSVFDQQALGTLRPGSVRGAVERTRGIERGGGRPGPSPGPPSPSLALTAEDDCFHPGGCGRHAASSLGIGSQ